MKRFKIKDEIQSKLNKITTDKPWCRESSKEFIGFGTAEDAKLIQPDMMRFDKEVVSTNNKLYLITTYISWWRITNLQ